MSNEEVAVLQRRRLKKVIDPMRSLMALEHAGYRQYLSTSVSNHAQFSRDAKIMRTNFPWLVAAAVPLSYLTKSLLIPMMFLNVTLYGLLYSNLVGQDCFYCQKQSWYK